MTELSWTRLSTPVGPVSVGCTAAGVARVRYGAPRAARPEGPGDLGYHTGDSDPAARALADAARRELTEYFCGVRQVFGVPVDWTAITGLQRAVLGVLAGSVGYGHTISYGALARAAGLTDASPAAELVRGDHNPNAPAVPEGVDYPAKPPAGLAARTVGTIMSGNPIPVVVPCHRVVAADGLGGFSGGSGPELKRWLLTFEGAMPAMLDFGEPAA